MAPGTSDFEGPDNLSPRSSGDAHGGSRGSRGAGGPQSGRGVGRRGRVLARSSRDGPAWASGAFPDELRGLLRTEMSLHEPNSDLIRHRFSAAVAAAPRTGSAVSDPYATDPHAFDADAGTSVRTGFGFDVGTGFEDLCRPIDLGEDADQVSGDAPEAESHSGAQAHPWSDLAPDDSSPGLPARVAAPSREARDAEAGPGADPHPGTAPLPLYGDAGRSGRRAADGRRRPAGRGSPRGGRRPATGRRRAGALVGVVVAVLTLSVAAALALLGMPGRGSPKPTVTTVTAPPHPTTVPWPTGSASGPPSRQPEVPAPTLASGGVNGQAGSAGPARTPSATSGARPESTRAPARPGATSVPGASGPAATDPRAPGTGTGGSTGIYASAAGTVPAGTRVQIPTNVVDWSLFGNGWGGVSARAARAVPQLVANVTGTPVTSPWGFDWMDGTPTLIGSDETQRLAVQGTARLSTFITESRQLDVYLGSSTGQVQVTISSIADTRTFTVALPAALDGTAQDARVTLTLPGRIGATAVSISAGDAPWTLAAAILR